MGKKLRRARGRERMALEQAQRDRKAAVAANSDFFRMVDARDAAEAKVKKLQEAPWACFRGEAWTPKYNQRLLAITQTVCLDELAHRLYFRRQSVVTAYPSVQDVVEPIRWALREMSEQLLRGILEALEKDGMPGSRVVV